MAFVLGVQVTGIFMSVYMCAYLYILYAECIKLQSEYIHKSPLLAGAFAKWLCTVIILVASFLFSTSILKLKKSRRPLYWNKYHNQHPPSAENRWVSQPILRACHFDIVSKRCSKRSFDFKTHFTPSCETST